VIRVLVLRYQTYVVLYADPRNASPRLRGAGQVSLSSSSSLIAPGTIVIGTESFAA
jgi:hypothetical protein